MIYLKVENERDKDKVRSGGYISQGIEPAERFSLAYLQLNILPLPRPSYGFQFNL